MAEGFGDLTELHHVNAALPAFNLRYKALRASQAIGEFDLSDPSRLTGCDEELNEFLMPLREER